MSIFLLSDLPEFPDPEYSDPDGLLAVGGDLSEERLLKAYRAGIFPWYEEPGQFLWWSPPERMIVYPLLVKVSHSMKQTLKKQIFEVRRDTQFEKVIRMCAATTRYDQAGTWITPEMVRAYCLLHQSGYAHSFETYFQGELVGGLYGVSLGKAFFGESMFHLITDASKVAFLYLAQFLSERDFHFIDAQIETNHLRNLGGVLIKRTDFLSKLNAALKYDTLRGKW